MNTNADISLHMALSNAGPLSSEPLQPNDGSSARYPVTLRLNQASSAIWDTISRWIGGDEKNVANKKELEELVRYTPSIDSEYLHSIILGPTKEIVSGLAATTRTLVNTTSGGK
jgi:hypothetical protein